MHYDSCAEFETNDDGTVGKRYTGVLQDFFSAANEWVHIAWVKTSGATPQYIFYKNGVQEGYAHPAPAKVQLSEYYNIGHNDNYFVGSISEVSFFDFKISAADVQVYIRHFRFPSAHPWDTHVFTLSLGLCTGHVQRLRLAQRG